MDEGDLLGQLRIEGRERGGREAAAPHGRRVLLFGGAVLLMVVAAVAWPWREPALLVRTVVATRADDTGAVLQATGFVIARRQTTVSAQIVGTLVEIGFEEGEQVEQGQVLARLDDRAQRAQLDAARAGVRVAEARMAELEEQLRQAERDGVRTADLAAQRLVPEQQAEQARTDVQALRAQRRSAEAQLESARAQVAIAQVHYENTVIRAPFTGVVTQKAAQVGEIIAPSAAGGGYTRTGVCTIVDMDSLEVGVDINEAQIQQIRAGMAAEAVLNAYPQWTIPAQVIAIVPTADRSKASVRVRVALAAKDRRIVPDMGVRVAFLDAAAPAHGEAETGVLLPDSAVTERDGRSVVFVVEEGRARLHLIDPQAPAAGGGRLLQQGVAAGALIIDEPPETLTDGASVRVARR